MDWEDEETQYATDSDAYSGSDDEEVDYVVEDDDTSTSHQKPYTILTEIDIRLRQDEDIAAVSNVLSVSTVSASNILRHYNWNVNIVQEAWFEDEEKVRKTVGLVERPVFLIQRDRNYKCKICLDMYNYKSMNWADCGHPFCVECLKRYISVVIADGPGCLVLRCPEPDCVAAIGQDMVNKLASDEDREKYVRYLVRSYVEVRQRTKWCPAPGCDYAVEFDTDSSESYNVKCKCSNFFCWNCGEEAHTPVDCDTVAKWIFKNSDEAENTQWILANSKPCPKCKNPIEKNQGCMHMTCRAPCKFEFCWLCLGAWSKHGEKTGGFYACNVYRKEESEVDESERIRERAKMYIERYAHHYERWLANHNSRQKAIDDLQKVQTNQITKLVEKQNQPEAQLKFIIEAWQQIVECRRVLKWTYAYGYYLLDDEHAKRQLFEYFQGEAESGLERLHNCVEKEVEVFLDATSPSNDFIDFHEKLAGLTRVTRNYFENLVQALENGLSDVYS